MKPIRLLFVDDEQKFLEHTTQRLRTRGLEVHSCSSGTDALAAAKHRPFDVALVDLKMPGMDGEELLAHLKKRHPLVEVVILTGHGSVASAVRATQSGAFEYLQKPCELADVLDAITRAYAKRVSAVEDTKAQQVEQLMKRAPGLGALELLRQLKKIDEGG